MAVHASSPTSVDAPQNARSVRPAIGRQPFVGLVVAAVAGIITAEVVPLPGLASCAAALGLGVAALRWRPLVWLFVAAVFAVLHTMHDRENPGRHLAARVGNGATAVEAVGVVDDAPNLHEDGARFPLRLEEVTFQDGRHTARARVMVFLRGAAPAYGDRLRLNGVWRNVQPPRNPGQFDEAAYLRRQGIFSRITVNRPDAIEVLEQGRGNPIYALALRTRDWMQETLRRGLETEPEISGLMQSMVLGLREETTPDTQELFRQTGTLHLFAVSGLNVAMLAYIAWMVVRPLGLGRGRAMGIVIPLVLFYAAVTGLTPSGVRAAIMTVIVLAGFVVERPAPPFNTLAAAAFLIMLRDSNQLFATGFQLSFGVVLALLLLGGPFQRAARRLVQPDPFLPRSLLGPGVRLGLAAAELGAGFAAVSLAAWLGSLPFGLWYFHLLPSVAVVANVVAVPLAFVVLATGMLAFVAAPFATGMVVLCNNANYLVVKTLLAAVGLLAQLPGGHVHVGFRAPTAPPVEITVFDFGSGGAAHVQCGGRHWLIDCGRDRDYRWTLQPFLRRRGVNRLDGVVLTHGDVSHIGGAPALLREYPVGLLLDAPVRDRSPTRRKLVAWLRATGRGRSLCWRGDVLTLSNAVRLHVLYPPAGLERREADDKALVLLLETPGCRVLFLGDSGFATEKWLLEQEAVPRCDILVKGQHARDYSGTAEFLARAQPALVIAAHDDFQPDKALAPEWCAMLRRRGIALFRLDETGAVTLRVWPAQWTASAFLNGSRFGKGFRVDGAGR